MDGWMEGWRDGGMEGGMGWKEKPCIKLLNRMKMCIFVLFCLKIIFFLFSTALQKLQKIVTCFPEDKLN